MLLARFERMVEHADTLLASNDAGTALFTYFRDMVGLSERKNAYADALAKAGIDIQDAISPVSIEFTGGDQPAAERLLDVIFGGLAAS